MSPEFTRRKRQIGFLRPTALLIAGIAVAAVMKLPELSFVITVLRHFGSRLAAGAFWPKVT